MAFVLKVQTGVPSSNSRAVRAPLHLPELSCFNMHVAQDALIGLFEFDNDAVLVGMYCARGSALGFFLVTPCYV